MSTPVRHPNLNEVVREAIEEQILSGELAPGGKVAEAELAGILEVSRTPVKLALVELSQEGIIDVIPRRGAYVKIFSKDDMVKIQQVRAALEGLAVKLAAVHFGLENYRMLKNVIDEYQRLGKAAEQETDDTRRRDIETRMKRLDLDFHNRILDLSGNEYLVSVARRKNLQFQCFINKAWGDKRENRMRVTREHKEILQSLKHNDPASAERLLKEHITGH
ncbi:MAG: GntR family transcriptional regulator [Spirochaetia bacterium]